MRNMLRNMRLKYRMILGGVVTVYSEVGKGSVFNAFIPAVEMGGMDTDEEAFALEGGTERLVFVDDEAAIAESMELILTTLGYRVTTFTDSVKALAAIKTNPSDFDVIVTDHAMPEMTGLEIAKNLREAGIHIPIILMSGYFNEDIETSARSVGIWELIPKPINAYRITRAIRNIQKEDDA